MAKKSRNKNSFQIHNNHFKQLGKFIIHAMTSMLFAKANVSKLPTKC